MGRHSKFSEGIAKEIYRLAKEGKTDAQMADLVGVSETTFNNWKKRYPEFMVSLKESKSVADELVETSLFQRACGYTHKETKVFCTDGQVTEHEVNKHYPPDPTSMIFWLKNRRPDEWRDKLDGEFKHIHEYSDLKLDQLIKLSRERGLDLPPEVARRMASKN